MRTRENPQQGVFRLVYKLPNYFLYSGSKPFRDISKGSSSNGDGRMKSKRNLEILVPRPLLVRRDP